MSCDAASEPSASVVVVTRNRKDLLRSTLASATTQQGAPEVLVMDDGSTDGTPDMVEKEFAGVRLFRSQVPRGYIVLRNKAAELVRANIIVSLDDDARFSSSDTVATTVAEFNDPRIGAVAMPLIHTARGPDVLQRAPAADGIWITNAYIGTAHAVRRDVFLDLSGYREELVHFFEEPDFCLRLMRAGFVVRLGRAAPILHEESIKRDMRRGVRYLWRNHLLFTWFYIPLPYSVPHGLAVVAYAMWSGIRLRHPAAAVAGLLAGVRSIGQCRRARSPVSRADYRRWRSLRRRPARLEPADSTSSR